MTDMGSFALRRAGAADAAAIKELTFRCYQKWVSIIGRDPLPMTVDYEVVVREHLVDLYEPEQKLVALIEMAVEKDHLLIVNIAVDPDTQNQGLGVKLLSHAQTVALELGLSELRLYADAKMAPNIAFYARHGFEEFKREPTAALGVMVYMRRFLDQSNA